MFKPLSALVAAVAFAAPAMADNSTSFDFQFRFNQADLSSVEGAGRVHQQLLIDASKACRKAPPSAQRGVDSACRDGLVEDAVKRINNPLLSRVHSGAVQVANN